MLVSNDKGRLPIGSALSGIHPPQQPKNTRGPKNCAGHSKSCLRSLTDPDIGGSSDDGKGRKAYYEVIFGFSVVQLSSTMGDHVPVEGFNFTTEKAKPWSGSWVVIRIRALRRPRSSCLRLFSCQLTQLVVQSWWVHLCVRPSVGESAAPVLRCPCEYEQEQTRVESSCALALLP